MKEPEGATPLDPDERNGLLFPHIDTKGELDQMEQVNIQQGLQWLQRQKVSSDDLLSDYFARKLHEELFKNVWRWAGIFRGSEKNIGVAPGQVAVQLRLLMDDARYWVQAKTFSEKELAIRFHHRLVQIHPFANGNGRHSRIMADAVLTKLLSAPPIKWGGSDLNNSSSLRMEYIRALRQADKGDYSVLLKLYG